MTSDNSPERPTRRRSPRGQGARLRDELLDAAEALLAECGTPERVRIGDVVERVGVTPPALYAHFADKDALFAEVQARRFTEFRDILRAAVDEAPGDAPDDDPWHRLRRRGIAYVRYVLEHPDIYRTLFMTERSLASKLLHDQSAREMSAFDDLVDNVRALIDHGSLRSETDPELVARSIWATVHGIASLAITVTDFADPYGLASMLDESLGALESGLRARHGAPMKRRR